MTVAAIYTRSQATVKRLLAKYGMPATIHRTDPVTNVVTLLTTTVIVNRTVLRVIGDTQVQLGDDELIVNYNVVPKAGDRIVYGAENRVIAMAINPIDPGGVLIYTMVYARKG